MSKRNTIYYEFWKQGSYVATGMRTLGKTDITTGIDIVPTMSLTIPLQDLPEENLATYDIRVYFQVGGVTKYKFIGVVDDMAIDYANYAVTLNLSHRIVRMREWLMPVNYTVKNTNISHALGPNGAAIGYQDTITQHQPYDMTVELVFQNDPTIEMTFSSENKLAALTEAIQNTEKLHWRVDLSDNEGDRIIIGEFGQKADCIISPNPTFTDDCDEAPYRYVTMLTEPVFNVDYTDHYNRAVVFCGDLGEGVLHLTLKEIYERPDLWVSGFPIGRYDREIDLQPVPEYDENHKKINNEKIYENNAIIAYANNVNREYYVTDTEQLNADGGIVKHTTFNFSNLYPIPKLQDTDSNGNKIEYAITDADRVEMGKRAYLKAIRELKAQRPQHTYQFNTTAIPTLFPDGSDNVVDGSKVRFAFVKKITEDKEDCNDPQKRTLVNINEDLYVTRRVIIFDEVMNEYGTITLDKELRPRAINAVEIQLKEKVEESGDGGNTGGNYKHTINVGLKDQNTRKYIPDDSSKYPSLFSEVVGGG